MDNKQQHTINMVSRALLWRYRVATLAVFSLLLMSCLKKEYMPPSVGEEIPYEDSVTISYVEVLAQSPYTIFNKAWEKSNIGTLLESIGDSKTQFTLLIPENTAMEEAGWTLETIGGLAADQLDTLVMSHVFRNRITEEELLTKADSYQAISVLELPNIRYTAGGKKYYFRIGISLQEDALWVNGKEISYKQPIPATDGYVWPIKELLEVPSKSAWEVIQSDSRFSIYAGLLNYTDSLYRALFEEANGYPPEEGHLLAKEYNRKSPLFYGMDYHQSESGDVPFVDNPNTWFIPTNTAFQRQGFNNLNDLIQWNESRGLPESEYIDDLEGGLEPFFSLVGEFATDTLLDYHHNWGMRIASYDLTRERNATYFFSNDLKQELLGDYPITAYTEVTYGYYYPQRGVTSFLFMPFEFPSGGKIKIKGAESSAIELVDKNINTLNGVIHVVDELLIPPNFTLNN